MTNDESPLTLTLSPEYGGEGKENGVVRKFAQAAKIFTVSSADDTDWRRSEMRRGNGKLCTPGLAGRRLMGIIVPVE
jgi:hypothetical protein